MVYFVQDIDGGPIKIGKAVKLSLRLPTLEVASGRRLKVLGVMDGQYETETKCHRMFNHLRVAGEWFNPGDDLLRFIKENAVPWDGIDEHEDVYKFPDSVNTKKRRSK